MNLDLQGTTRDAVLEEMVRLVGFDERSSATLLRILRRRENLGSTGVGRGLALPQQVLDVVCIDQYGTGEAHHHQGQQQDQADPEMDLLQPVAERASLRLRPLRHRHPPPNATAMR